MNDRKTVVFSAGGLVRGQALSSSLRAALLLGAAEVLGNASVSEAREGNNPPVRNELRAGASLANRSFSTFGLRKFASDADPTGTTYGETVDEMRTAMLNGATHLVVVGGLMGDSLTTPPGILAEYQGFRDQGGVNVLILSGFGGAAAALAADVTNDDGVTIVEDTDIDTVVQAIREFLAD